MDALSITLGLSETLGGLLLIALSVPLLRGKIKRNPFYGVRLRQSMQSDEAWYAINRYWAKRMIAWGIPLVIVGIPTFFFPFKRYPWAIWIAMAAVLIAVFIPAVQSWFYARREWNGDGRPAR
jgi:hypothetical protein